MTDAKNSAAMILAAGLGTRMRPLTLSTPKPLIEVAGRALIDYSVDNLKRGGICDILVNVHYLAGQVEAWAERQTGVNVTVVDERDELLETGGGVANALGHLGKAPFFVLNSDSFWRDNGRSSISIMADLFDESRMDFLLLLAAHEDAVGFDGPGDFFIDDGGRLSRRGEAASAPYIFAGCYMSHQAAFAGAPAGPFSANVLWDRALAQGRLHGVVLDGLWLHVGTPGAIKLAQDALAA